MVSSGNGEVRGGLNIFDDCTEAEYLSTCGYDVYAEEEDAEDVYYDWKN